MAILVKLSAALRQLVPGYDPMTGLLVEAVPGEDIGGLCGRIGVDQAQVKIFMLNGLSTKPHAPVADGDRVGLFPAVGGG